MMRKLDFILVSWKILSRRVSRLPGSTPQILPQYGFQVDLSITRIWLWVSVVLKTFPWLPCAYRTAPKRLRLVCKALCDLAPCFYFISPYASYPFCFAYAKRLPSLLFLCFVFPHDLSLLSTVFTTPSSNKNLLVFQDKFQAPFHIIFPDHRP